MRYPARATSLGNAPPTVRPSCPGSHALQGAGSPRGRSGPPHRSQPAPNPGSFNVNSYSVEWSKKLRRSIALKRVTGWRRLQAELDDLRVRLADTDEARYVGRDLDQPRHARVVNKIDQRISRVEADLADLEQVIDTSPLYDPCCGLPTIRRSAGSGRRSPPTEAHTPARTGAPAIRSSLSLRPGIPTQNAKKRPAPRWELARFTPSHGRASRPRPPRIPLARWGREAQKPNAPKRRRPKPRRHGNADSAARFVTY